MPKTAAPPRPTGWCSPDTLTRLADDPARTASHERCQRLGAPCPCPCHTPEELPVTDQPATGPDTADPPPDRLTPDDALDAVALAADDLNAALLGYHPDDWTDAVRFLHHLRRAVETLRGLDANLVRWLYLHGEHGVNMQVAGIPGGVSVTRGRAKVKWEANAAVGDYVAAKITELGGELPDPEVVIRWVLEVAPVRECRVTPLRAAGMDVEDYRVSEPGNLQVGLPR